MKTLKLFSLSLLLSLACLANATGNAQTAAQTKGAAAHACCKADKGHAGCCAGDACETHAKAAGHHAQGHVGTAGHAAHAGAQHAAHAEQHKAHAQGGDADACPMDGCCCVAGHKAGQRAEGQQEAADDCCKMHGEKSHAAHAQHQQQQGATAGGEKAHASCCVMHGANVSTAGAKGDKGCCSEGASCCAGEAAGCAAAKAKKPE